MKSKIDLQEYSHYKTYPVNTASWDLCDKELSLKSLVCYNVRYKFTTHKQPHNVQQSSL